MKPLSVKWEQQWRRRQTFYICPDDDLQDATLDALCPLNPDTALDDPQKVYLALALSLPA